MAVLIVERCEFWYVARDFLGGEICVDGNVAVVQGRNIEDAKRAMMKLLTKHLPAWKKWNLGGCRLTLEVW